MTRRYKRKSSKIIDRYISEAEQKLQEERYTSMDFLKVVAHVTEKSFDKNHSIEGNQSAQAEEIENEENQIFNKE